MEYRQDFTFLCDKLHSPFLVPLCQLGEVLDLNPWMILYNKQSSTKRQICDDTTEDRSLIYKRNSKGPCMISWGILKITLLQCVGGTIYNTTTHWMWLVRKVVMLMCMLLSIAYWCTYWAGSYGAFCQKLLPSTRRLCILHIDANTIWVIISNPELKPCWGWFYSPNIYVCYIFYHCHIDILPVFLYLLSLCCFINPGGTIKFCIFKNHVWSLISCIRASIGDIMIVWCNVYNYVMKYIIWFLLMLPDTAVNIEQIWVNCHTYRTSHKPATESRPWQKR